MARRLPAVALVLIGAASSAQAGAPAARAPAGSAAPAPDAVVEQVVAVVRGPGAPQPRVITMTRLEEEARIALVASGGTAAATAPLDAPALRAALAWLVDQTLLGDEAARLQVFEVEQADVDAELRRFRERFARAADYRAFLDRLELPEEELAAVLRRTMRVRRYVESRAGGGDAAAAEKRVRSLVDDLRRRSDVRVVAGHLAPVAGGVERRP